MSLLAAIRLAAGALLIHKGRSFLTSLGIIIGIGAVIAVVAAVDGVQYKLDERMATIGKNLILIRAGARTQSGSTANLTPLTRDDAAAIRKQVGPLLTGIAEVQLIKNTVRTPTTNWVTDICGTTPEMQTVREWKVESGRFFTDEEVKQSAAVCVLGRTVADKLFPHETNIVGRPVHIGEVQLRVIGVLSPKGRNPAGADQDDEIFVPVTTLQQKLDTEGEGGKGKIMAILAGVKSENMTAKAIDDINRVLRETHKVKPGNEDFDVSSVQEMAQLAYFMANVLQLLVAVIASLSLAVGGVGIMNIMLVSVMERTREIGIRMAVGATAEDVLTQFLIEAVILALLGGALGVAAGLGAAGVIAYFADWPLVVSPVVIVVAVAVSGAVGVFFGFYPAWKASRLDPIEALRYE
jgi:putative ABC transport system permease protein